jgi:hypothetical protein
VSIAELVLVMTHCVDSRIGIVQKYLPFDIAQRIASGENWCGSRSEDEGRSCSEIAACQHRVVWNFGFEKEKDNL